MKLCLLSPILSLLFGVAVVQAQQRAVTIAVVNNPDMIELKKLSPKFEEKNPDIKLNWVIAETSGRPNRSLDLQNGLCIKGLSCTTSKMIKGNFHAKTRVAEVGTRRQGRDQQLATYTAAETDETLMIFPGSNLSSTDAMRL